MVGYTALKGLKHTVVAQGDIQTTQDPLDTAGTNKTLFGRSQV